MFRIFPQHKRKKGFLVCQRAITFRTRGVNNWKWKNKDIPLKNGQQRIKIEEFT